MEVGSSLIREDIADGLSREFNLQIMILEVSTSMEASPSEVGAIVWNKNRVRSKLPIVGNKHLDFRSSTLGFLPKSKAILHHFLSNLFLQFLNKITHKFYEEINLCMNQENHIVRQLFEFWDTSKVFLVKNFYYQLKTTWRLRAYCDPDWGSFRTSRRSISRFC